MERQPISSSNIKSAGYDPVQRILEIEFHGGVVWQYASFPEEMWHEFLGAPSQGKYFHAHVRERFSDFGHRVK